MGRIIDINNNAQVSIIAEICDYVYINPSVHRAGSIHKDLRYLSPYIDDNFYHHGHNYTFLVVKLKPNCIVIAFRGTHRLWTDIDTDFKMFFRNMLSFWADDYGSQVYTEVRKILAAYPGYHVIFAGHSLGGAIAKLCALNFGKEAVTFNSFSVVKLQKKYFPDKKSFSLISNLRVPSDIVSKNVRDERAYGAKHHRCCHVKLKDIWNLKKAHVIERFRRKLAKHARHDLEKKHSNRELFWKSYSSTPVGGALTIVEHVANMFWPKSTAQNCSQRSVVPLLQTFDASTALVQCSLNNRERLTNPVQSSLTTILPGVGLPNNFNNNGFTSGSILSSLWNTFFWSKRKSVQQQEQLGSGEVTTETTMDHSEELSRPSAGEQNSLITFPVEGSDDNTSTRNYLHFFNVPISTKTISRINSVGWGIAGAMAVINGLLAVAYGGE